MGKQYTVEQLVSRAESLVDEYQLPLALTFYEKALKQEPKNVKLLEIIGELAAELGHHEKAIECLKLSIKLAPDNNASKYFYLAQLVQGQEAEEYTRKGIYYLEMEIQQESLSDQEQYIMKKQISDAYCALGELYITDLCDQINAEQSCEECYQLAMTKYDVGLPEAIMGLANLRLIQQRKDDAIPLLEEAYHRFNTNCNEDNMPSIEFRVVLGKSLLEIEKYEFASDIFENILQEDDENAEIWFLLATCVRALDEMEMALEYFEKCQELLKKLAKELQEEFHLQDQLEIVNDAIATLKQQIQEHGIEDSESDANDSEEKDEDGDIEME